jgi:hypothetical protein
MDEWTFHWRNNDVHEHSYVTFSAYWSLFQNTINAINGESNQGDPSVKYRCNVFSEFGLRYQLQNALCRIHSWIYPGERIKMKTTVSGLKSNWSMPTGVRPGADYSTEGNKMPQVARTSAGRAAAFQLHVSRQDRRLHGAEGACYAQLVPQVGSESQRRTDRSSSSRW